MNILSKIKSNGPELLTLLSVSPVEEDHLSLDAIVGHSRWKLLKADGVPPANRLLQEHEVSVVVCERDLRPGTFMDVLKHIQALPHPPSLIVSSRLADDFLWAEAMNLGAWDVLAKPFDRSEVVRCVKGAWDHWRYQIVGTAKPLKVMKAAS